MAETTIGLIILIATLVALTTILTVLFTYGRKIDYPKGNRFKSKNNGLDVVVIVDEDIKYVKSNSGDKIIHNGTEIDMESLAFACGKASRLAKETFIEKGFKGNKTKSVVFWFRLDEKYDEFNPAVNHPWWGDWVKRTNAFAQKLTRKMLGNGPGIVVCRDKFIPAIIERGQPAIHEVYHILMIENHLKHWRWDTGHKNDKVWATFGKDTAEAIAQNRWNKE